MHRNIITYRDPSLEKYELFLKQATKILVAYCEHLNIEPENKKKKTF